MEFPLQIAVYFWLHVHLLGSNHVRAAPRLLPPQAPGNREDLLLEQGRIGLSWGAEFRIRLQSGLPVWRGFGGLPMAVSKAVFLFESVLRVVNIITCFFSLEVNLPLVFGD